MLWTVRHLWSSIACLVFNFYRHCLSLVLRNGNGTAIFIHSREGVAQGEPLAMITYGIGIFPLIKNLKRELYDVTQTWYADDARELGTLSRIETNFNLITLQGPGR